MSEAACLHEMPVLLLQLCLDPCDGDDSARVGWGTDRRERASVWKEEEEWEIVREGRTLGRHHYCHRLMLNGAVVLLLLFLERRSASAQYGASVEKDEPVTGSSGMPAQGAMYLVM